MKKYLLIFLVYCFSLTVISCGTKDDTSNNTSTESSTYSDNGTTFTVTVNSSKYYIDGILTKSLNLKKDIPIILIPLIQPLITILYLLAQPLLEEVILTNTLLV